MKKELFTTTESGNILGISRIAVFKRIKKGKMKAIKAGRDYLIPRKELRRFFAAQPLPKELLWPKF